MSTFHAREKFAKYRKLKKYLIPLKNTKNELFIAIITGILYGLSSGFGIPVMLRFTAQTLFVKHDIPTAMLVLFTMLPVVTMLARAVCGILNAYFVGYCGQTILRELRVMVFDKIQRLPLEFFKKTEPGELITRSLNDTSILQGAIIEVSQEIVKQPMAVIGAFCALIYLCWRQSDVMVLLIFIVAVPLIIIPIRFIGEKMRKKTLSLQKDIEKIMTQLAHNLSAVQEVRAFAMEDAEVDKYRFMCENVMRSVMKTVKYSVMLSPIIEVIAACGVGIAMTYSYLSNIGADVFIALAGALYFSYDPIKRIARLNNLIKSGAASFERIEELLNQPEKITDPAHPVEVGVLSNISFKDVKFCYDEADEILHGVNLDFKRGYTYALVGSSGAGKSTITNLILRFYDVNTGSVTIDGIDVRDMRLGDLRRNISIVPQVPTLINGTIFENILWSSPGSSKKAVVEASKRAYAHDFIIALQGGYDTNVGENGTRLSGGQRQRIALARAFLRNAPILILDEATSALDANSEHAVHRAIEDLIANKTTILISHRFTMMSIVDKVFVLEKGSVIEEGSPDELSKRVSSVYHGLYQKQRGEIA